MKTLDEIQEEVKDLIKGWNWPSLAVDDLFNNPAVLTLVEEVAHRFAKEVAKEALKNASDKIKHDYFLLFDKWNETVKQVTDESNIPAL